MFIIHTYSCFIDNTYTNIYEQQNCAIFPLIVISTTPPTYLPLIPLPPCGILIRYTPTVYIYA